MRGDDKYSWRVDGHYHSTAAKFKKDFKGVRPLRCTTLRNELAAYRLHEPWRQRSRTTCPCRNWLQENFHRCALFRYLSFTRAHVWIGMISKSQTMANQKRIPSSILTIYCRLSSKDALFSMELGFLTQECHWNQYFWAISHLVAEKVFSLNLNQYADNAVQWK